MPFIAKYRGHQAQYESNDERSTMEKKARVPLFYWLLVFVPVSIAVHLLHLNPTADFIVACLAI